MKTIFFTVLYFLFFPINLFAQFSYAKVSAGLQYSDVHTLDFSGDFKNYNATKRGLYLTFGTGYTVLKWLKIEASLTYQERKALEVFHFPFGDSSQQVAGVTGMWIFAKYPTSPQSSIYNSEIDHPFPNFKYLNLEFIPMFEVGQKPKISAGFGLFGGILLNPTQMVFGRKDFPRDDAFFEPPFNLFGEVSYHEYDFGYLPKIAISYPINHKINIGASAKAYLSRVRLNDTFVAPKNLQWNMRWESFLVGIDFQYRFPKKEKRQKTLIYPSN